MRTPTLAAVAAVACAAGAAAAGPITTIHIDMPPDLGVFGLQYFQDFLVPAMEGRVVESRIHVTFNTAAGAAPFHDAADILFQMQLATVDLPFWDVSGTDLGWSGTGTFSGSLSTTAFNADLLFDPDADFFLWFPRIVSSDDANPFLGGTLIDSYWEFDIAPIPGPGAGAMALVAGAACCARRRRGGARG